MVRQRLFPSAAALCFAAASFVLFPRVAVLRGQSSPPGLAAGRLLVADRSLRDPNFAETVILLVQYDQEKGAMGLTINRRTDVPLSRAFRSLQQASSRKDTVYVGGPVDRSIVFVLLRSRTRVDDAQLLFDDVYVTSSKEVLEKQFQANAEVKRFHAYVGYAGWGDGQLEHEVAIGAWRILPASALPVFDSDPDTLWSRLIQQTELHVAAAHY